MSTPQSSAPPPEGLLLEQARKRLEISQNEAGRRAGISGTRWRQITYERASGMTSSRGVKTIARMAAVVEVTAEQFAEVGREDVARTLREQKEPTVEDLKAQLDDIQAKVDRLLGIDPNHQHGES